MLTDFWEVFLLLTAGQLVLYSGYSAVGGKFKELTQSEMKRVRDKLNLPDQFLLYVGDGNFVKNIPFLIEGFNRIIQEQKFENLKLVLVNKVFQEKPNFKHPELKSLHQTFNLIDQYNLRNSVITPGQVELDDLVGLYNLATIYIQPSLYEGFGFPVLEAMKCGAPVVSSDGGSLKEIGGDAALYFDPRNMEEFVATVKTLLQNSQLSDKLKARGLERSKEFNWKAQINGTIRVYEKAIQK